ncbi:hypothetical protein [Spirosoma rhododendri]|uniref:Uncharacterized protein n=1 Tax=Spirosoma rhododendri TaxID=2728024 RepID=A0A7L5DPN0_9BACT|nr:hypothetical protein [Spirosoma rhododendri]QJD77670.1 hypothetical protein HH216_03995 [Spirosoma rhododendri]
MAQTTFTLTKKDGSQTSHAETTVDIGPDELKKLTTDLKASQPQQFGELATIYVAPESYALHVDGQDIPVQPQFFPAEYGYIINDLMSKLKPADR